MTFDQLLIAFRRLRTEVEDIRRRMRVPLQSVTTTTGGGGVLVKLTGNATGGGWYNGNLWTPPATTPAGTSTLSEAQMGTSGAAVLVCNVMEVTKNTHDIKFSGSPSPYQFIFPAVEVTCGDNGTFYAILGTQWGC